MIRALAPPAALLIAAVLAGCGGDDEETVSTPASMAPADTLVYGDAVLRPEGEERTAIEAPLAALLDTEDPGAILVEELDRGLADEDPALTYAEDIEPWLGERGAVYFSELPLGAGDEGDVEGSFAGEGYEGAFIIDVTDADAAQAFVDKAGDEDEGGEVAVELVGDALVFGSERGVEAVADTEAGGDALADDPGFEEAVGDEAGAAARLYADVPGLVAAAAEAGELPAGDREALDAVLGGFAEQPLAAVATAETTGFGLEVSYGATNLPFASAAAESALLRELPADSWLAAGFADAGEAIGSLVESAEDFGVGADAIDSNAREFRREYGLELEHLYEPLGDGALFASGEGIFGAGGGVVFEVADQAAVVNLLAAFERAARRGGEQVRRLTGRGGAAGFSIDVADVPGSINFVGSSNRLVIAYGEAATVAALDPDRAEGTLGESERFTEAESKLGDGYDVSAYFDFAPLTELLDLAAATDPALQRALPYLDALDYAITGSAADGERERQKLFLGISGIVAEPSA